MAPSDPSEAAEDAEPFIAEAVERNVRQLLAIQRRELRQRTAAQRCVERIATIIGSPRYLGALLTFALVWVAFNSLAPLRAFDRYPYPLLGGLLALAALVSTTVILVAQNRQTRLEQQHTHLALQVNLLTEHKVSKLIHLIEELRRDLPMVRNRQDPQAEKLQQQADAKVVAEAINRSGLLSGESNGGPLTQSDTSRSGDSPE